MSVLSNFKSQLVNILTDKCENIGDFTGIQYKGIMIQNSEFFSSNNLSVRNRKKLEKVFRHKQIFKRNILRVLEDEYLIYINMTFFDTVIHAVRKQD